MLPRGARWHTADEIRGLFAGLPIGNLVLRSAVFVPSAGAAARIVERVVPQRLLVGAFIVAAGDVR